MKLGDLIDELDWDEVQDALLKNYGDIEQNIVEYEQVFYRLKGMESAESDMKIHVVLIDEREIFGKDLADDPYWVVHGTNGSLNKEAEDYEYFKDNTSEEWANSEQTFALELTPWNQWLAMDIDDETANNIELMRSDIVAHCIWEMTFCGYEEEQIQDKRDDLISAAEDAKNGLSKGISFESVDEMLKYFEEHKDDEDKGDEDDTVCSR